MGMSQLSALAVGRFPIVRPYAVGIRQLTEIILGAEFVALGRP